MTSDLADLARRAVASPKWKWMPGMAYEERGRKCRVDESYLASAREDWHHGCTLVVDDPATLGTMTALVREAWGDPRLVAIYCEAAHPGQSEGWAVQTADNRLPVAGGDYGSEAEALVAALEAAPVLGG